MSSDKETTDYIELRPGDRVQVGDQWLDQFGQWHFYTHAGSAGGFVNSGVKARRPSWSAGCFDSVACERIAYEELRPGTEVQAGDQYRNTQGRWVEYTMDTSGVPIVSPTAMARRPHNITQLQGERDEARAAVTQMMVQLMNQAKVLAEVRADEKRLFDDLELLRREYATVQQERDELKAALHDSHAAHEFTMKQGLAFCKERNEANEEIQKLLQTITDNADQFAVDGCNLQHERDEARAERDRLQEVVNNLYNEPTARQVQEMLRTWATELDWSAGCFDSAGREQIDTIQKALVAVIERIETMIHPEGGSDGE